MSDGAEGMPLTELAEYQRYLEWCDGEGITGADDANAVAQGLTHSIRLTTEQIQAIAGRTREPEET